MHICVCSYSIAKTKKLHKFESPEKKERKKRNSNDKNEQKITQKSNCYLQYNDWPKTSTFQNVNDILALKKGHKPYNMMLLCFDLTNCTIYIYYFIEKFNIEMEKKGKWLNRKKMLTVKLCWHRRRKCYKWNKLKSRDWGPHIKSVNHSP